MPPRVAAETSPNQQVPIGARALGMGGAFTSIADDATALYWNPAGLPYIGHQEITALHANLFGLDINDNFVAAILPLSTNQALGFDWYSSGFEDEELDFGENRLDVAYAHKITSYLSVGGTGKFLSRNTDLDQQTVRRGNGFGLDLGLIVSPTERLRAGLICQDLTDTHIDYSGEAGIATAYPREFRGGLSYAVIRGLALAFDADDRWHAGAECRPIPLLALRGGIQDDWSGPDGMSWSAGAGIKVGILRFDYALVDHPVLGSTNYFGLSAGFNFNPSQIRIEKVEARDVYASLYRSYASEPMGTVKIRNLSDRPIEADLRVLVPQLMRTPSNQRVSIRPKAVQDVDFTAVLPKQVLEDRADRAVQVEVSATYLSRRLQRTERSTGRCMAYGAGAINWGEGVAQAAAFVTPRDPAVDALARTAIFVGKERGGSDLAPNLIATAALYDAVAVHGVVYVADPNNPYDKISKVPHAVDTVSYPRETLVRKSGDCDDTSVLMAALLANIGIRSKFVDVPGHIFLLADTGISGRNAFALGLDEDLYTVVGDEVWIPLETTALSRGFAEAWRLGAETYAALSAKDQLQLVDLDEAFSRYEPAELGGEPAKGTEISSEPLSSRLRQDLETVRGWRREYISAHYGDALRGVEVTPTVLNDLARVYFHASDLSQAQTALERAYAKAPNSPQIANNLANVLVAQGQTTRGAQLYESATRLDPQDAGIWLNLGIARTLSGDSLRAEQAFGEGIKRSGGWDQAARILGMPSQPAAGTRGSEVDSRRLRRELPARPVSQMLYWRDR